MAGPMVPYVPSKPKGMKRSHSIAINQQSYPPLTDARDSPAIALSLSMGQWRNNPLQATLPVAPTAIPPFEEDPTRFTRIDTASPQDLRQGAQQSTELARQTYSIDNPALARQNHIPPGLRSHLEEERIRRQNNSPIISLGYDQGPAELTHDDQEPLSSQLGWNHRRARISDNSDDPNRTHLPHKDQPIDTYDRNHNLRSPEEARSRPLHPAFSQSSHTRRPVGTSFSSFDARRSAMPDSRAITSPLTSLGQARPGLHGNQSMAFTDATITGFDEAARYHRPRPDHLPSPGVAYRGIDSRAVQIKREYVEEDNYRGTRDHDLQAVHQRPTYSLHDRSHAYPYQGRPYNALRAGPPPFSHAHDDYAEDSYGSSRVAPTARGPIHSYDRFNQRYHHPTKEVDWQGETRQNQSYDGMDHQSQTQSSQASRLQSPVFSGSFGIPGLLPKITGSSSERQVPAAPTNFRDQEQTHELDRHNDNAQQYLPQDQAQNQAEGYPGNQDFRDRYEAQDSNENENPSVYRQPHQGDRDYEVYAESVELLASQAEVGDHQAPQEAIQGHEDQQHPAETQLEQDPASGAALEQQDDMNIEANEPEITPDPLFPIPTIVKGPATLLEGVDYKSIWQERLVAAQEHDEEIDWARVRELRKTQGTTLNNASNFYETMLRSLVGLQSVKDKEVKRKVHLTKRYRGAISTLYGQFSSVQSGPQDGARRRKTGGQ
ncbi:hypothetical protein IAT40_003694 [Kwoniella sp. CBS 6097]